MSFWRRGEWGAAFVQYKIQLDLNFRFTHEITTNIYILVEVMFKAQVKAPKAFVKVFFYVYNMLQKIKYKVHCVVGEFSHDVNLEIFNFSKKALLELSLHHI